MCIGLARLSVPAGQADQISLAIAEEGQLFFPAGLAERDVGVGVDQARVGVCGDASVRFGRLCGARRLVRPVTDG